jgi:hypothetical protein
MERIARALAWFAALSAITVAAMGMFVGVVWSANPPTPPTPPAPPVLIPTVVDVGGLPAESANVRTLMDAAGISSYLRRLSPQEMVQGDNLSAVGFKNDDVELLSGVVQGSYDEWDYNQVMFYVFRSNWNTEYSAAVRQWFDTQLGGRVLKAEATAQRVDAKTRETEMSKQLKLNPASKSRLESVKKLETIQDLTGFSATAIQGEAQILMTLHPEPKKKMVELLLADLKGPARSLLQAKHHLGLLYIYRGLADEELEKLVQFVESPAGSWYYKNYRKGLVDAQAQLIRKAVTSVTLLREGRRRGEDVNRMTMQVFRPGVRYMFINRRDPFAPVSPSKGVSMEQLDALLVPSELVQKMEEERGRPKVQKFSDIDQLRPLPVELLNQLKESNPGLYKDIQYYAGLFKKRKELEAMSDQDYLNTSTNYKMVIDLALRQHENLILTPLQIDLKKLRFNGVVWNGAGNMVLVETPDKKGHTARKGTLIGANFGAVESISQEKVIVVERMLDYKGDPVAKTVEVELFAAPAPEVASAPAKESASASAQQGKKN